MQPFVFLDRTGVNYGAAISSNEVTVTEAVTVSVTNGSLIVNHTALGFTDNISLSVGDVISIQVISATLPSTAVHSVLTSNGQVVGIFRVQTKANPYSINQDYYNFQHHQLETNLKTSANPRIASININDYTEVEYLTTVVAGLTDFDTLFFSNFVTSVLYCFNPTTNTVVSTIDLIGKPVDIAAADFYVYVVTDNGYFVSINRFNLVVENTYLGLNLTSVKIGGDGNIYISATNNIPTVPTIVDHDLVSAVQVDEITASVVKGSYYYAITTLGNLQKIDSNTLDVVQTVYVSSNLWDIVAGANTIWVVSTNDSKIYGYNEQLQKIHEFDVQYCPSTLLEVGTKLFVSVFESKKVVVLDIATGTVLSQIATNNKPTKLYQYGNFVYVQDVENPPTRLIATDTAIADVEITPVITKYDRDFYSGDLVIDASVNTGINISVDPIYHATLIKNNFDTSSTSITAIFGDSIKIRAHIDDTLPYDKDYQIGVFVGDTFLKWDITCQKWDITPYGFYFDSVCGAEPYVELTSNTIIVDGLDGSAIVTLDNGTLLKNGVVTTTPTTVSNLDQIAIRMHTSHYYETPTYGIVTIGDYVAVFGAMTKIDPSIHYLKPEYKCTNILNLQFDGGEANSSQNVISIIQQNGNVITLDPTTSLDQTSFPNTYYVTVVNHFTQQILILDDFTKQIVKAISVPSPIYVGYCLKADTPESPGAAYSIVASEDFNLYFLDAENYSPRLTDKYTCTSSPYAVSSGFDSVIFVTLINEDKVIKLAANNYGLTLQATYNMPAGSSPSRIYSDVNNGKIWVTLSCSNKVAVITTNGQVSFVDVGNSPAAICGSTSYIYVANAFDNTVTRITKSTLEKTTFYVCDYPTQIAVAGTTLYVASFQSNIIYKFDTQTLHKLSSFDLPNSCYGLDVDEFENLYVASYFVNTPVIVAPLIPSIPIDGLESKNIEVIVGATDTSNQIEVIEARNNIVSVPNINSATLLVNGTPVGTTASVKTGDLLSLSIVNQTIEKTYLPVLYAVAGASYGVATTLVKTPNPFYFNHIYAAYVRQRYTSNEIKITGMSTGYIAEFSVNVGTIIKNGEIQTGNTVSVKNGDRIRLSFRSKRYYANSNSVTATCGEYSTNWKVTNLYVTGAVDYSYHNSARDTILLGARDFTASDVTLTSNIEYSSVVGSGVLTTSIDQRASLLSGTIVSNTILVNAVPNYSTKETVFYSSNTSSPVLLPKTKLSGQVNQPILSVNTTLTDSLAADLTVKNTNVESLNVGWRKIPLDITDKTDPSLTENVLHTDQLTEHLTQRTLYTDSTIESLSVNLRFEDSVVEGELVQENKFQHRITDVVAFVFPRSEPTVIDNSFALTVKTRLREYLEYDWYLPTNYVYEQTISAEKYKSDSLNPEQSIPFSGALRINERRNVRFSAISYLAVKEYAMNLPTITNVGYSKYYSILYKKPIEPVTKLACVFKPVDRFALKIFQHDVRLPFPKAAFFHYDMPYFNPVYIYTDSVYPRNLITFTREAIFYVLRNPLTFGRTETMYPLKEQILFNRTETMYPLKEQMLFNRTETMYPLKEQMLFNRTETMYYPKAQITFNSEGPYNQTRPKLMYVNAAMSQGVRQRLMKVSVDYLGIKTHFMKVDAYYTPIVRKLLYTPLYYVPLRHKYLSPTAYTYLDFGRHYYYVQKETGIAVNTVWFDCFESCVKSGMFEDSGTALADAIAHGYQPSKITISKTVHNCWIWSILVPPKHTNLTRVGGYIQGG